VFAKIAIETFSLNKLPFCPFEELVKFDNQKEEREMSLVCWMEINWHHLTHMF